MDIRDFFSRKRKNNEGNDELIAPAKKKRKLSVNNNKTKHKPIIEQKENEENKKTNNANTNNTNNKSSNEDIPSIQSLNIKNHQENEEKYTSDHNDEPLSDDDDEMESNDDDDIQKTNNTSYSNLESVSMSKTKAASLATSCKYDVIKDCGFNSKNELEYIVMSQLFDKLGSTTKRLEKVEMMSRLFRSIIHLRKDDSLLYAVYLCCNEIAPPYEGLELGIGDSIILKALCESTGRKLRDIKADYTKAGDLGDVAVECRSSQNTLFKPKSLKTQDVFKTFKKIAQTTGTGTQQEKVRNIQRLFVSAKSSESRYIVRHLQGKLRIGVNEQTVLAALGRAIAFNELKILNKKTAIAHQTIADLEGKYTSLIKTAVAEIPNYSIMINALIKYGINNLDKHCHLTPGIPIKVMLAKPTKGIADILKRFDKLAFTLEYKYDGERAQIHLLSDGTIKIFSRNAEDNTAKFPELIESVSKFKKSDIKSFIIDSEIVAYDRENDTILPFSTLMTRKRKNVSASDVTISVCIYAFDCLLINDKPLIPLTFNQRRAALYSSFREIVGEFCFAHHRDTSDPEEIAEYLNNAISIGKCEGLMIKTLDVDATYEPSKRSHSWLKCKKDYLDGCGDTLDLVVMGAFHGTGKRTGTFGSYLVGAYNDNDDVFQSICKVATGFKQKDLIDLDKEMKGYLVDNKPFDYDTNYECDVWFEPKIVWELKCADLTISPTHSAAVGLAHESKGIALRFPRFMHKRDDKGATSATTAQQVYEMYTNQAIFN